MKMKNRYSKKEFKGKESGSCSGRVKEARGQASETGEELDFAFPSLQTVDKKEHLHCFSSILSRGRDEYVTMEEVDRLQPELEVMFSCAAVRARTLRAELAILTNSEEARTEIKPVSALANQRKRKQSDARLSKSLKDLSKVRNRDNKDIVFKKELSSENDTDNSAEIISDLPAIDASKVSLPKNDTPNKFWASVEPYCRDITKENIKDLEEMVAACETDLTGVPIPPLGRHYSSHWLEEDLSQEREKSEHLIKRANSLCERTPGPLVQRLVSALMEDPSNDSFTKLESEADNCPYLSKLPLFHTTACFERRLKRELEAAGFLDSCEGEDTDEIKAEIQKCEEELKIIAGQNKEHLELLISKAKQEMKRQEVKNKIRVLDHELTEIFRKNTNAKLKKKQLKKKEKDNAWKVLKEREQLIKVLEGM